MALRINGEGTQGHDIDYPLIGGPELKVAKAYDMLPEDAGTTSQGRTELRRSVRMPMLRALAFCGLALHGSSALVADGLSFYTVTPCRLVDTRNPKGPYGGPALQSGSVRIFTLTGAAGDCLVPATAKALSVNMTSVAPDNNGHLTFYPGDASPPLASSLNFGPGQTRANNAILRLAGDGTGRLAVEPVVAGGGQVHLVLDLNGYFKSCVAPSPEACNNVDDDCDDEVDEGLGTIQCGLGVCQTTVAACSAGTPGMCVPAAPPSTTDGPSCDGLDNDCDGAIDEDCSLCVRVALTGNDTQATADNNVTPFRNIQTAITWAAANPSRPQRVCVAAGALCSATGTYAGGVTMANGISVYGNYRSSDFTRCANSLTILAPGTATGVLFPNSVSATTVLDGFRIDRGTFASTAAVTVDGATNVLLTNLTINNTPIVTNSYGVNLVNGASALVARSDILGGTGSARSVGVRASGSVVRVRDNCAGLNIATGRCDGFCTSGRAIRGRLTPGTGEAYAVLLESSPGSSVEQNSLCTNDAETGAGVRVTGDGTGVVVRGNLINAYGGALDSHGVWMEDCSGAAPWVVDNHAILATGDTGTTRTEGVRAIGDCHPVIDHNVLIAGGGEGAAADAVGIRCGANGAATPSRCVVVGNTSILGSNFGSPPFSAGVLCSGGSCLRIAGNTISGRAGTSALGLLLDHTATLVEDNRITGGCGTTATGIRAVGSAARLQNNLVFGGPGGVACASTGAFVGLEVVSENTPSEMDVHSNDIDGAGLANACSSSGLALSVTGGPPPTPRGIYRNNILRGGLCNTRVVVRELSTAADPRIFQNNDLDPFNAPGALYFNEGTTALTTAAQVNALGDMTSSGNISVDPMFASYPTDLHLTAGSFCIGAGTASGAPLVDFDGQPRDPLAPDIGADEYEP